jgi:hypothetical protein
MMATFEVVLLVDDDLAEAGDVEEIGEGVWRRLVDQEPFEPPFDQVTVRSVRVWTDE